MNIMKKVMCVFLSILLILGMSACGAEKQEQTVQEGFKPSMDTSVKASIKIAGGYDNFEALEAEIDRFNERLTIIIT